VCDDGVGAVCWGVCIVVTGPHRSRVRGAEECHVCGSCEAVMQGCAHRLVSAPSGIRRDLGQGSSGRPVSGDVSIVVAMTSLAGWTCG